MPTLTTIGTGDAFSTGGRFQTCFLLDWGERRFLVDCGANGFLGLRRTVKDLGSIDGILITHFHGDHYGGLPFYLLDRNFIEDKSRSIQIWAPQGAMSMIRDLSENLYPGLGEKLVSQEGLMISEYRSEAGFDFLELEVMPIPVVHAPESIPHGFRISDGDKTIAFSGDTQWNDNILRLASGTDLMVLECNNFESIKPGHVTYSQIKENRDQIVTRNLVLNHFGPEMLENEEKVEEMMANDGGVIEF